MKINETEKTIMGCMLIIPLIIFEIILSAFLSGWAFTTLWGWFIVPIFNAPILTYLQSVGLMSVVMFATRELPKYESSKKQKDELWEKVIYSFVVMILKPVFAVLFGWIIFSLMKG